MSPQKKPIVLVCTGLGRVQRGFEMYIASLAEKLVNTADPVAPVEVWTGGPWQATGIKSRKIASIGRNSSWLKKQKDAFVWEQRSFAMGMLPRLLADKPTAIYLGEYQLYCYLYKLRQLFRLRFSLVLYTGGQAIPGLFNPQLDFVHHVTDVYLPQCRHILMERQFLVPHFIEDDFVYDNAVIAAIKQKAGGKKIVLSVGLLDCTVKRMDYLIKSLAPLAATVFPVLLGDSSKDTPAIRQLLEKQFGAGNFMIDKMPHKSLGNWYRAADLFALCSPKESFGLAYLEAVYHGLPVICADFPESRFVLKDKAVFLSMQSEAALTNAVKKALATTDSAEEVLERKTFVATNYGWPALSQTYIGMFEKILRAEWPAPLPLNTR